MTIRALELFCGIGGFAAAVAGSGVEIVGALDQDETALQVYRLNFPDHDAQRLDLEKIDRVGIASFKAEFWWLSPPCQPYCLRGTRRDLDDPRAKSLLRIMEMVAALSDKELPLSLALENVEGFAHSQAHDLLVTLLARRGFKIQERHLCPTELGVPSRRPRYYLTATRLPLAPPAAAGAHSPWPLKKYLAQSPAESALLLPPTIFQKFGKGLRILDGEDPEAYTTCFTSGYGKSVMRAGSYLRCGERVRYFTPEEIARLLHFPDGFRFPAGMPLRRKWHLLGNSLSVVAVRHVLGALPGFEK